MEEEIKKLREAGFTDADIQAYVNDQQSRQGQPQAVNPAQMDTSQPPVVDEKVPAYGAPPGSSILEDVATVGSAVAPYAGPAALAGLGIYGAAKVGGWGSNMLKTAQTAGEAYKTGVAQNAATQEFRALERMARGSGPEADAARQRLQDLIKTQAMSQPVAQTPRPTASVAGPVSPVNPATMTPPASMPPPAASPAPRAPAPSMMQRGTDIANQMRQFAAQRVIPVMGQAGQMAGRGLSAVANSPFTRVGGTIANAAYSGDLNTGEAAELERRRKMAPTITR